MGFASSNIVTISSGTITLRGNKSFSVSMQLQGTSTASKTMTISDIGGYEIDLDVQESASEVNELFYNVGQFKFNFWSVLSGGANFGEYLLGLDFTDLIKITVTYDGNSGIFACQKSDFKYDERKREVEVTAYSPFKYADQVVAYSTTGKVSDFGYNDGFTTYDFSAITLRDLIDVYLETFGESSTVIETDFTTTKANLDDLTDSNQLVVLAYTDITTGSAAIDGASGEFVVDSFANIRGRVLEAGLAESAIIGNFLGEAFYVRRDTTGNIVSIGASDLEDLSIEFFTSPVKTLDITIGTGSNETTATYNAGNTNLPQTVNVTIPNFGNTMTAEKDLSPDPNDFLITNPRAGYREGEMSLSLATNALNSYKNALGAVDSIKFSGVILGADTIKPYSIIRLDTNVSEFVDTNNRDLRPTKLKFDLKEDKIEFEAYSI